MGTHAIDWIMSWWTLTALARRASSRALIVDDGLARLDDPLGDRAREARVRVVAALRSRAVVRLELAALVHEERRSRARPPSSATAWSVTRCEEAREVVLGRELARDLEDAREAILGETRSA